jgi:hypothetical protein
MFVLLCCRFQQFGCVDSLLLDLVSITSVLRVDVLYMCCAAGFASLTASLEVDQAQVDRLLLAQPITSAQRVQQ